MSLLTYSEFDLKQLGFDKGSVDKVSHSSDFLFGDESPESDEIKYPATGLPGKSKNSSSKLPGQ